MKDLKKLKIEAFDKQQSGSTREIYNQEIMSQEVDFESINHAGLTADSLQYMVQERGVTISHIWGLVERIPIEAMMADTKGGKTVAQEVLEYCKQEGHNTDFIQDMLAQYTARANKIGSSPKDTFLKTNIKNAAKSIAHYALDLGMLSAENMETILKDEIIGLPDVKAWAKEGTMTEEVLRREIEWDEIDEENKSRKNKGPLYKYLVVQKLKVDKEDGKEQPIYEWLEVTHPELYTPTHTLIANIGTDQDKDSLVQLTERMLYKDGQSAKILCGLMAEYHKAKFQEHNEVRAAEIVKMHKICIATLGENAAPEMTQSEAKEILIIALEYCKDRPRMTKIALEKIEKNPEKYAQKMGVDEKDLLTKDKLIAALMVLPCEETAGKIADLERLIGGSKEKDANFFAKAYNVLGNFLTHLIQGKTEKGMAEDFVQYTNSYITLNQGERTFEDTKGENEIGERVFKYDNEMPEKRYELTEQDIDDVILQFANGLEPESRDTLVEALNKERSKDTTVELESSSVGRE